MSWWQHVLNWFWSINWLELIKFAAIFGASIYAARYVARSEATVDLKHLLWLVPLSMLSGVGLLFLAIGTGLLKINIGG